MTAPPSKDGKKKSCLAKNAILILTVCGVVCGVGLGIWMRSYEFTHDQIKSIAIPGEILMRMFTMIVIPLVVISLIVGTGNLDPKQMGKLGGSTLGFFLTSCFVAAVAGTVIASLVHPGDPTARIGAKTIDIVEENRDSELSDTILDLFRNVFTDNLFASTMYTTKTEYEYRTVNATDDHGDAYNKIVKVKHVQRSAHMNILGLVVFSVTVGVLVGRLGDEGKPLLAVCNACDKVIAKMVLLIIWYSPVGILFLIMEKILQVDNLSQAAGMVGMYLVATYIGQLFVLVTNCIVYFVFTRRNPFKLLWGLGETLLMAIGTSSSTACLPVTFKCAEKNMKISHPICQLVLPIGATVHMVGSNGTANETTRTIKVIKVESMNIMGWVVISLLVGAIVGHLRRDGRPVLRLVIACDKVINKMVMLIIYYSPFGVLFLIAEKILRIDNVSDLAKVLGMFIFVDVLVQFILFILLLAVYVFFTRKNPLKLVAGFSPSIAMAIGTSASTACLPVSLKCMEERMGISKTICRLVLPVGATINMNGTAAHLAVSSLFIAQLNGSEITFGQYAVVLLTSSIAAAATAGVSSASLFTMIIVLSAINQPIEDISLLVSVDWFVNRFRVINNVFGDAVCACVLEHYYGAKLLKEEEEESAKDVGTTESKDTEKSSKSASTRTEATQCSNDEEEAYLYNNCK